MDVCGGGGTDVRDVELGGGMLESTARLSDMDGPLEFLVTERAFLPGRKMYSSFDFTGIISSISLRSGNPLRLKHFVILFC